MSKKLISILMVVIMLVSLVACAGDSTTGTNSEVDSQAEITASPEPESTAEPSAESDIETESNTEVESDVESEPVESEPVESEPVESEPSVESKPPVAESEPVESAPESKPPVESNPPAVESEPVESEPVESEPESEPVESEPAKDPYADFEWVSVSGGARITAYNGTETVVVVPDVIGNKRVVEISDETFSGNYIIEKLVIPETVKEVHIRDCESLTHLVMMDTIVPHENMTIRNVPIETLEFPNAKLVILSNFLSLNRNTTKRIIAPKCTNMSTPAYWNGFANGEVELQVSKEFEYFEWYVPNYSGVDPYISELSTKPFEEHDEDDNVERFAITDSNRAIVYCTMFDCNKVTLNGKVYATTDRYVQ